jgi:hypothetical protein
METAAYPLAAASPNTAKPWWIAASVNSSSASSAGSYGFVMKGVRALRKWDHSTDIFCNNKIFEEMAEAWKSEMWLV